jgi:ABC-type multidrug transport system fused ATPase/permease subunit
MVGNLFKLPQAFFDVTPTGRIVQRCSKDVDAIDYILPFCMRSLYVMSIGVRQNASRNTRCQTKQSVFMYYIVD